MEKIISNSIMQKIKNYIVAHKITSAIILLAVLYTGYWGYGKLTSTAGDTRYVSSAVTRGTIISSINGSGQVSVLSQIDLKPSVSGTITYIGVKPGDQVRNGKLLFSIDSKDAQKAVRDAQISLDSANLSLEKLKQPADALSIIQAENSLAQAKESKLKAETDLVKIYDDGFNTVSNTFLDLSATITGLSDIFFKNTIDKNQDNITWYLNQTSTINETDRNKALTYKADVSNSFNNAQTVYLKNLDVYKSSSRYASSDAIEALILETYDTTKIVSDTLKTSSNYIDFVKNAMDNLNVTVPVLVTTHRSSLNSYIGTINGHLLDFLSIKNNITNSKTNIIDAERSITENEASLAKLKAGTVAIDLQSAELSVKQKENALQDAKDNLANYSVIAPFDGTISSVPIQVLGETASSGTILGTIITTKQLATISLNEVDVAKIKLGQKATLTFDAIPNFSIAGVVAQIDTVGTVSQGVVTYNVKISFDSQDSAVKPGMSVSASIITDVKQDVLVVQNTAVKSQGNSNYVEMFNPPLLAPTDGLVGSISIIAPNKIPVVTGLSNNTQTEIVSGLKEGDEIVTRTILPTASKTTTPPSILGGVGGNRGGGVRIPGQ